MRVGIVINEFFHDKLGGFGGYGFAAKNIAQYFNLRPDSGLEFRIYLSRKSEGNIKKVHDTLLIFPPKEGNLLKRVCSSLLHRNSLKWPDVFITIQFLERYLLHLSKVKGKPVIIWLQDPRDEKEWKKVESVKVEQDFIGMRNLKKLAFSRRRALGDFLELSKERNITVLFATQANSLIERAESLYDRSIRAPLLPNPIEIPQEVKWSEKSSKPSILFLGRLDPVKRPWLFCELAKRVPEADFFVAGIPHKPEVMEPILKPYRDIPNLHFLGLVTGQDKEKLLRRSWILVNTSVHEGLPVSWLEALAYKMPIVASVDTDEYASRFGKFVGEFMGEGFEAVPVFEEALWCLIDNKELRENLGEKGFKHVSTVHSFSFFEKRLREILERIDDYKVT